MAYSFAFEPTHHINFISNRKPTIEEIRKAVNNSTMKKAKRYADKFAFEPMHHASTTPARHVNAINTELMNIINTLATTDAANRYINKFAFEPTHHVNFIGDANAR